MKNKSIRIGILCIIFILSLTSFSTAVIIQEKKCEKDAFIRISNSMENPIITVDDDGNECDNASFTSIQEAIDSYWCVEAGVDRRWFIHVYPGLYEENIVISGDGRWFATIIGVEGPEQTVIHGLGDAHVLQVKTRYTVFEGFTFMNSGENCPYHNPHQQQNTA